MNQPLIVNLAPTGMVPTRDQSAHVPLTPAEIARDVAACVAAGASIVHLHARADDGVPTDDPNVFAEIVGLVREQTPEVVVTVTTSGRKVPDVERRAAVLRLSGDLRPDMASLTLGSMNFTREASVNAPATIMRLAEVMRENGIRPELEVFDVGMVNVAHMLIDKGLIEPPYYFNILLGNPATAQLKLLHLATLVNDLPEQSYWALAGIGRFQAKATALGAVMAHGVRVGLEDNLWLDAERTQPATNLQMVERAVRQARAVDRSVATPAQVRSLLQLAPRS